MSAITSSTTKSQPQKQQHSKMLTDFSIHSLIGDQQQLDQYQDDDDDEHVQVEVDDEEEEEVNVDSDAQLELKPTTTTTTTTSQRKYRPKNFRCPACKMAFSNNGQLKNHVRIHTGERPFRCVHHECNKTFTRNEELTRHKLIHTGVRPHACTICGKRFGRKDHLKKHVRTHDRKRIRRKVFVQAQDAFAHLRDEHMFSPPKPLRQPAHDNLARVCLIPPGTTTATITTAAAAAAAAAANLVTTMAPPSTTSARVSAPLPLAFSPTHPLFNSTVQQQQLSTTTNATASTLQQLASDYWTKWYNFLGFYQQHQPNSQFYHNQNQTERTPSHHLLRK